VIVLMRASAWESWGQEKASTFSARGHYITVYQSRLAQFQAQ
jgi:hypothetical protein